MRSGVRAPTTSRRCSRRSPWVCSRPGSAGRSCSASGTRSGRAFHDFDVAQVAAMTERDVDRLLQDPSIIRNRAKIQATVENARAMRSASPSLAALARSYATHPQARAAVARRPPHLDTAGGGVRQAAEVTGIPLRRTHERVRVHAERRRGQRPHPWLLPSHGLHRTANQLADESR